MKNKMQDAHHEFTKILKYVELPILLQALTEMDQTHYVVFRS